METTTERDNLRYTKIPLTNRSGVIPALDFGTLIPDPIDTKKAIRVALETGFRQFDSAERYRNEKEVGEAMQEGFKDRYLLTERLSIHERRPWPVPQFSVPGRRADEAGHRASTR